MTQTIDEQSTSRLIEKIQHGQDAARDELFQRCLPLLRRFAHGRLPASCRDLGETDDLVQSALLRALKRVHGFDSRGRGAFFAYLRQITLNVIRDEIRKRGSRPEHTADFSEVPAIAGIVDTTTLAAYEQALAKLGESQRAAIIMRFEFDMSYPEIAVEMDSASADAARMLVARGLKRLAETMA
ncbi:MAG: sigma-70 family RNA polymerase sigma factor [Rudaea sp.]